MRGWLMSITSSTLVIPATAPADTRPAAQSLLMTDSAYPTGTMPLRMAATIRYSNVQMTSEAMMPMGRSRLGFFASSAVVDTASNPMYAKKTTAAPVMTPEKPYGMNGDQFSGFTYVNPTRMKNATAASLIATIAALNSALSRTPTTSSTMMPSTIRIAGILTSDPVAASGDAVIHAGR